MIPFYIPEQNPVNQPLKRISPAEAAELLQDQQALLVDVREPDEHARERIPGAICLPLSSWDNSEVVSDRLIFHCRSGARTNSNSERLVRKAGGGECYLIEGGLDAWKKAGLPVELDRRRPIDLMRQVQIAAGSMAAVGTLLGALVSPWFLVVPAFVGSGLTVAGLTGFCGLGRLLMLAPWNRSALAQG